MTASVRYNYNLFMVMTRVSPQIYEQTTLDNGLRMVTCEMPHTRSVSISAYVGVGSRFETDDEAGLSHFVEHMMFKGTESRPDPLDISAQIESSGGAINAGTEQELTVYWCKVAQPYFADSMALMVDMLRNSLFRPDDIEKERNVIHEELAMISDYPSARVDSMIDEMLWPGHPLGRDVGGTRKSVDGIGRDMLLKHMESYYAPSNIVVSVAGNVVSESSVHPQELAAWHAGRLQEQTVRWVDE